MVGDSRNRAEVVVNGRSVGSFAPHEWGAVLKSVTDRDLLSGCIGMRHQTPDGPRTFYPAVAYKLGTPLFPSPDYLAPRPEPRTDRYLLVPALDLPTKLSVILGQPWVIEHWDHALCRWSDREVTTTSVGEGAVIPLGSDISSLTARLTIEGSRVVSTLLCTEYTSYAVVISPYIDRTLEGVDF